MTATQIIAENVVRRDMCFVSELGGKVREFMGAGYGVPCTSSGKKHFTIMIFDN